MVIRISTKLGKKIHENPSQVLPVDSNPYADWSAHLFSIQRVQYILFTNTTSLYSIVMCAKGITDGSIFLDRATTELRTFMEGDGMEFFFEKFIVPSLGQVSFSKPLNRSVIGSMSDFVNMSQYHLTELDDTPYTVSRMLNDAPMSYLKYSFPKKHFRNMVVQKTPLSS